MWPPPETEASAGMSQVSAFGEGMSGGADEVPAAWNAGKFGMVVGIEPNAAAEIREGGKKEEEQRAEWGEREGEGKEGGGGGGGGEKEVKATVSQR